ncbi:reverse transcriptase [Plakobranchus ocellatus]|uniref:Reverse transcriptase n=1 Tax=Plakobranchus ocellatus TaxID=259542 RepID=A0AAV4DLR6_9GAST|nr:reverse transcriptase [Plakobranchus ocellatus]
MTAEGVYITKEQDSRGINQFRPISLLNGEGKIFFSVMASRLTKYLTENGYINTSLQKGGIPGVSGCLEHATMIWEAIQRAKSEKLNLDVVWLDLANAYGSVPHEMIQLALRMYHVPEVIQVMFQWIPHEVLNK